MLDIKGCQRCHGDLYAVQDRFGEYVACLQCGHVSDVKVETVVDWPKGKQKAGRPKKRSASSNAA